MIQDIINEAVFWLATYAGAGTLFAVYFVVWGAKSFDHGHEQSSLAARAILAPGVIAFWPYLFLRMMSGAKFEG